MQSKLQLILAGLVAAGGLLIPAAAAQAAAAGPATPAAHHNLVVRVVTMHPASVTRNGCPSGDVCMYTPSGWTNGHPEHKYFVYACYDLTNETGTRILANNQTGGAIATGYRNFGCTNAAWTLQDHHENEYNITPINSIALSP